MLYYNIIYKLYCINYSVYYNKKYKKVYFLVRDSKVFLKILYFCYFFNFVLV